jgi:hypothetical protein
MIDLKSQKYKSLLEGVPLVQEKNRVEEKNTFKSTGLS